MKKKKTSILAFLLAVAMVFGGCTGMGRDKDKKQGDSSAGMSSAAGSGSMEADSSMGQDSSGEPKTSGGDLESSGTESDRAEMESSSGEEAPVNAVPEPIVVDGVEFPDLSQYENTQVTWGPGHAMDEANRPTACVSLQEKYEEDGALFIMPAEEKKLYLTFDEGYENGYTEKILDVLKEKNCPAVFFVTYDYVSRNPELVQRMVDEGHVVGNHSMHHPNMTTVDAETAAKEIADLHNYVVENFNFQMTLFRPPEGAFSERSLIIARELGYKTTLWSYGYADWDPDKQMSTAEAFPKVTGAAHNGAVYLLHAVSKTNTEILGSVIDTLREEGYSLEKLE